jgi:hypothetical protein
VTYEEYIDSMIKERGLLLVHQLACAGQIKEFTVSGTLVTFIVADGWEESFRFEDNQILHWTEDDTFVSVGWNDALKILLGIKDAYLEAALTPDSLLFGQLKPKIVEKPLELN